MLTALALMIAELSVGAPPARACAVAAREISEGGESPSEVAEGLTVLAARAELGGSVVVDGASESRGQGSGSDSAGQSWRRIAVAWRTAEHSGVPMGELLESLRADLAARRIAAHEPMPTEPLYLRRPDSQTPGQRKRVLL